MFFHRKYIVFMLLGLIYSSQSIANEKQELQSIRLSIKDHEKLINNQQKQRSSLIKELEDQEIEIAKLLKAIETNNFSLKQLNTEINKLITQIETQTSMQKQQQIVLAKQLENTFKLGRNSGIELVFSLEENERNERIINYYSYINEARQKQINELQQTTIQLKNNKVALETRQITQKRISKEQKETKNNLEKNQQKRQQIIKELDSSVLANQHKLAELRDNENKLQLQINKAKQHNQQNAQQDVDKANQLQKKQSNKNYQFNETERSLMARVSGIGKPMHRFSWPIKGQVSHHFGDPLQGELVWKGMVINAKSGTSVLAIADGRVILASWLQGYGFLIALDHGKGDMSLYGYNERLLVEVGNTIKMGQPIALVGNTGGQKSPSLYFEIRRDGKALDPRAWLKQ